jgi:hypothetical protein
MSDGDALASLFLEAPVEAGTAFVFDRRPDFFALLRMRGESRTFVAMDGARVVGAATALWHDARDGVQVVRVGEVADLRVAHSARGGRAAWRLLGAVREAFESAGVGWVSCLIGDRNESVVPLVHARAGFPRLVPLSRYASVHYVAWRTPAPSRERGVRVRAARPGDRAALRELFAASRGAPRWAPLDGPAWPDCERPSIAWLAESGDATSGARVEGALLLWDADAVRRLRVVRYGGADLLLRAATAIASPLGLAARLPAPGGVVAMWCSRALAAREARPGVVRALVRTALRTATEAGCHVVQMNMEARDPLLAMLPAYPRSTYWSTLYGAPFGPMARAAPARGEVFYADVALV